MKRWLICAVAVIAVAVTGIVPANAGSSAIGLQVYSRYTYLQSVEPIVIQRLRGLGHNVLPMALAARVGAGSVIFVEIDYNSLGSGSSWWLPDSYWSATIRLRRGGLEATDLIIFPWRMIGHESAGQQLLIAEIALLLVPKLNQLLR